MNSSFDGFEHRLVTVDDVKIHTVTGGSGSPIVLLHGFPQTWWEWRRVMPLLAKSHRVVAVDLRGAGFLTVRGTVTKRQRLQLTFTAS